jgi:glycosyltransferase involved in cell wall biosynthesis
MNIGIDCRTILHPNGERAGIGYYTTSLIRALLSIDTRNTYVLFCYGEMKDPLFSSAPNVIVRRFPARRKWLPLLSSHVLPATTLKKEKLDIFHGPANILPLGYRGTSVITVHDLLIYAHPEWFPDGQWASRRLIVPRSIRSADHIIAVSEATRRDIVRRFGVDPGKISVIPEGGLAASPKSVMPFPELQKKFHLEDTYGLFIGTIEPRKNLVRLVRAFDDLIASEKKRFGHVQLVLAGKKGWKYQEVFHAIATARVGHRIRYVQYVTEEEKIALLKSATVFLFPSLGEGFGLPVLEAMQCGTPTLTSKISALQEVVGETALLVDPRSIRSIRQGLRELLVNPDRRHTLAIRARRRARAFSWDRTARKTLEIYKKSTRS